MSNEPSSAVRRSSLPVLNEPGRLPAAAPPGQETDPVCQMKVTVATANWRTLHAGSTYYFCCEGCLTKFAAMPGRFLNGSAGLGTKTGATGPASTAIPTFGVVWLCPMDPEVRAERPGPCPRCGMALEPSTPTLNDADPELAQMTRRFAVSLCLTAPVFMAAMSHLLPGATALHWLHGELARFAQLAFTTPVVVWGGWPFFTRAWASLKNKSPNMFTLIGMGTGVAYLYSVVALIVPGLFPPAFRGDDGQLGLYFEAAAVIITLALLGQVLELRARHQTGAAIRALLGLTPTVARRVAEDGRELEVPLGEVEVGDHLRVRPGDKIPVDGVVIEGKSSVNEAALTGESLPIQKCLGARVIAGTLNERGSFVLRAERVGADTILSRIVLFVSEATRSRAPIQSVADRVARYFVPGVVAAAVATFLVWALVGPAPALAYALVNAVAVLIIACPCALGLATPMSITVGMGRGAEAGVLVTNAEALETLGRVDTLVIDKTGTLTTGKPEVVAVIPTAGQTESALLQLAASLERPSEHPLASAILAAALARSQKLSDVDDFRAIPGLGVRATVSGRPTLLGSVRFLAEAGVSVEPIVAEAKARRGRGETVVALALGSELQGLIAVRDPLRANAVETVAALRASGVRVVMLTGDHQETAQAVAREVGIDEVVAAVQPIDKGEHVRELKARGRVVAMAGDGINDAPALAVADVGIAMGTGTDVAMHAAAVTLLGGDLRGILRARRLSRAVMRNIKQNLAWAFLYNLLGVPLAAGVLYPVFGLLLSPMLASVAMSLSSVSVIANALRLRRVSL